MKSCLTLNTVNSSTSTTETVTAAAATNSVKLGELLAEKEAAERALEKKMERWEYLEELAAKIAGQE